MNRYSKKPMKRTCERLPVSDKIFIDFCRCLYQAKAIVRELQSFGDSVCPALNVYPDYIKINSNNNNTHMFLPDEQFITQVNKYLDTTFQKFNRLCQILLMVLSKMECKTRLESLGCKSPIKKERIDSFRSEVWNEWKTATFIKQRLLHSIQNSPFVNHSDISLTETLPNTIITTNGLSEMNSSSSSSSIETHLLKHSTTSTPTLTAITPSASSSSSKSCVSPQCTSA